MASKKKVENKSFVLMHKEGEEDIEVSPLVVEDHKRLGWKVVRDAQPEAADEEQPANSGGTENA